MLNKGNVINYCIKLYFFSFYYIYPKARLFPHKIQLEGSYRKIWQLGYHISEWLFQFSIDVITRNSGFVFKFFLIVCRVICGYIMEPHDGSCQKKKNVNMVIKYNRIHNQNILLFFKFVKSLL